MSDLIDIRNINVGGQVVPGVDGRYLHGRLGVQTQFKDWMPRRIEAHGFVENVDFTMLKNELPEITEKNPNPPIDYVLTLKAAMKITMSEGTEAGNQFQDQAIDYLIKPQERDLVDLQAAKTWMLAEVQAELTKMVDNVKRSLMVELKPELIKPMEDIRRNLVSELKSELSKPMEDFKRALKVEVPVKKDKPVLNAKKVPFKTQDTIIRLDQLADVLQNHGLNVTTGEVLEVLVEDGYLNKRFRPTSKGAIYIVEHQKRMGDVGGTEKSFYDMSAIELIPTVNFEGQLYFIQYFHKLLNQKPNLTLVR